VTCAKQKSLFHVDVYSANIANIKSFAVDFMACVASYCTGGKHCCHFIQKVVIVLLTEARTNLEAGYSSLSLTIQIVVYSVGY